MKMHSKTPSTWLPKLLLFCSVLFAGPVFLDSCKEEDEEPLQPILVDFTPASGIAGVTEVTITGSNFSTLPENNTVTFGSVVATVTAATTTSLTAVVPPDAVTGKISLTVGGFTVTSETEFIVEHPVVDFFTLIVDESYNTSTADHWIMASNNNGDWLDAQPYEGGETKVLRGPVSGNTFTLHLLTVTHAAQGDYVSIRSYGAVPVDGTWLFKTDTEPTPATKELSVQVTNYFTQRPFPNSVIDVTSNVGITSGGGSSSAGTFNMTYQVSGSPADILVTLYKDGFPHYAKFPGVTLPSTISVDAATDIEIADRTFVMALPENDSYSVSLDARYNDDPHLVNMSNFTDSDGGASVQLGYDEGYDKYATRVSYTYGKKTVTYATLGSAVEENPTFAPFNITVAKSAASDFAATSDLTFDVATITFTHTGTGMGLLWSVAQPKPMTSMDIHFKVKEFPSAITEKYPAMPDVDQILYARVSGYQYMDGVSYEERLVAQSQSRGFFSVFPDNYYVFRQDAE